MLGPFAASSFRRALRLRRDKPASAAGLLRGSPGSVLRPGPPGLRTRPSGDLAPREAIAATMFFRKNSLPAKPRLLHGGIPLQILYHVSFPSPTLASTACLSPSAPPRVSPIMPATIRSRSAHVDARMDPPSGFFYAQNPVKQPFMASFRPGKLYPVGRFRQGQEACRSAASTDCVDSRQMSPPQKVFFMAFCCGSIGP